MSNKEEFLRKILATFIQEATEGIGKISASLLELEKEQPEPRKKELLETAYREAHSLKGASRAVNLTEFEQVCQALESVFASVQRQSLLFSPALFDLLHKTCDTLTDILGFQSNTLSEEVRTNAESIKRALSATANGILQAQPPPATTENPVQPAVSDAAAKEEPVRDVRKPAADTVRVATSKIDELLFQVEELLTIKLSSTHLTEDVRNALVKLKTWEKESSEINASLFTLRQKYGAISVSDTLSREEQLIGRLLQFMEWEHSLLKTLQTDLDHIFRFSDEAAYETGMKIDTLLDDVKEIVSLPFFTILGTFPKICRDLARDKGKEVELMLTGDQIEIDRRVLEEIRNPLLHLLRNAIDHGIEKPSVREGAGKPGKGSINISVDRMENNRVEIRIEDDGAGINLEKLRKKAVRQGLLTEEEAGSTEDDALIQLIFSSGISTSDMITDISGRGLGLAIVREKIELLGGTVGVTTSVGAGTTFRIQIPLSMATFRGIIIRCGIHKFALSTAKVEMVIRVAREETVTIKNKTAVPYAGGFIPLTALTDVLGIRGGAVVGETMQVLVIGTWGHKIGFIIDEVLNEQEILLKNFNVHLKRVRNVAGATILGSGEVIVILNAADLLKSAEAVSMPTSLGAPAESVAAKKNILVVEDSITSRMLLKNILEGAGYIVSTAIDGVDGFFKLKKDPFDLVISDVDMPRMNGFDLTARIRSDSSLAGLPLILVTSLSKEEDRERGMEVGANAYIVKSSFDQTTLLDVIDRLI
jgi:two-component system chemotaxis sensor kinase CheA